MVITREDIDKFKRHIRKGITIKIGDDEFDFPSLTYEDLPDFWGFANVWMEQTKDDIVTKEQYDAMSEEEKNNHNLAAAGKIYEFLTPSSVKIVTKLCLKTIKTAYPEMEENILKEFVKDNFIPMMIKLIEANMPTE